MTLPPHSSPISGKPPTPISLRASMEAIDEKWSLERKRLVENKTGLGKLIFTVFLIRMPLNLCVWKASAFLKAWKYHFGGNEANYLLARLVQLNCFLAVMGKVTRTQNWKFRLDEGRQVTTGHRVTEAVNKMLRVGLSATSVWRSKVDGRRKNTLQDKPLTKPRVFENLILLIQKQEKIVVVVVVAVLSTPGSFLSGSWILVDIYIKELCLYLAHRQLLHQLEPVSLQHALFLSPAP